MEDKKEVMKDNAVYNRWDNEVMDKTAGEFIYIVCHKEEQQKKVVSKMTTDKCILESYEPWEDEKVILTFRVLDDYEVTPNLN